jgi:sulfur-oxidizing protein SoxX
MRRSIAVLAVLVAAPALAFAQEVAPEEVAFTEHGEVEASLSGAPGVPENGAAVMGDRARGNCVACHQVGALAEVPWHGEVGPPLDGAAGRWSEAELRGILANPKLMFPGTIMPAFYKTSGFVRPGDGFTGKAAEGELAPLLTAQEIEDVVAYLMTLEDG